MKLPTLSTLLKEIKKYNPNSNTEKIVRAFNFASNAHAGQKRKSGEDYIYHPLATTINLTKFHVDDDSIVAALLHDVPEDTNVKLPLIKEQFGDNVYFLVKGITKLSKVYYRNNMAERQIESLKKLLLHSAKDVRVILIKLADRLHNMQTIEHVGKSEKIERIAKETLEVYVPIANLLGIWEIKSELEDLCFKILYKEEYEKLASKINANQETAKNYINKTIKKVSQEAENKKIKIYDIEGRQKNLYSIFKKIQNKHYTLKSIYDIIGIRIICETKEDCYKILGLIHSLFTPKPYRFKDYIALPKSNGYQSIHTVVFGLSGISTEFQIRTLDMHLEAEYGIAAHYFYSYNKSSSKTRVLTSKSKWAKRILEIKKQFNESSSKIFEELKLDIFQDRIFVFTPKGDVVDLPKNATCIDFAYAIHSDIGDKAYKAEIDDNEININTQLKSGDIIKIITNNDQKPSSTWLDFAKTSLAKRKIKEALIKESKENQIAMGRQRFKNELYITKGILIENLQNSAIKKLLLHYNFKNLNELFMAIGEGKIDPSDPLKKITTIKALNYIIGFEIFAENRIGLFMDILDVFKKAYLDIEKANGKICRDKKHGYFNIYAKIENLGDIKQVFENIANIKGVIKVHRTIPHKNIIITLAFICLYAIWLIHPFIVKYLIIYIAPTYPSIQKILPYTSLIIIYLFTISNEVLFKLTIPEKNKHTRIWAISIVLSFIGLIITLAEIIIFDLHILKIFFGIGVLLLYLKLYLIYIDEKKRIESL